MHVHAAVELVPFLFGEQVEQILAGEDPARPPRQMVQELEQTLVSLCGALGQVWQGAAA